MQGRRRDAEGSQGAETISEAHAHSQWFSHEWSRTRIHFLGCFHIGGGAYFGWALPPNGWGTAHRYVQVQSHTPASSTTSKQLLWQ